MTPPVGDGREEGDLDCIPCSEVEPRNLIASPDRDLRYYCRRLVKRKRALLGSNPPRNSRLETHSDGWELIGTGRLPPPGVAKPPSSQAIGVDLPIPEKPTLPRHGASPA